MRTILSSIVYPILGLVFALCSSSCVTPTGSSTSSGTMALHSPTLAAKWQVQSDADTTRYVDPSHSLNFLAIRKLDGPGPTLAEPPLVTPLGHGDPGNPSPTKPYKQAWKYTTMAGQSVR